MPSLFVDGGTLCIYLTYVDGGDVHMIGIGVGHTAHHFAYYQPFQTTADGLSFLYCSYLQTNGGQDLRYRLCIILQVDVALQPLVRNIHFLSMYLYIFFNLSPFTSHL